MKNETGAHGLAPISPVFVLSAVCLFLFCSSSYAQFSPLNGVTVTSYTIEGERPNDPVDTSLTFQSSSNTSFNPAVQAGGLTGDSTASTNWSIGAIGVDYSTLSPTLGNLIGVDLGGNAITLDLVDTLSGTFTLDFSQDFFFEGADLSIETLANTTTTTADLAPASGPAVNLLATPLGTLFSAGQYTLLLEADVSASGNNSAAVAIQTIAVPEPASSALLSALCVLLWVGARRLC